MLNAIILLLGGITLGVLLASTLGSGIYQSVEFGVGRNKVLAQTNSQTGAIRLCEPVRYSRDDTRRGEGIAGFYLSCTSWFEKT
jgi:hypothetical protein